MAVELVRRRFARIVCGAALPVTNFKCTNHHSACSSTLLPIQSSSIAARKLRYLLPSTYFYSSEHSSVMETNDCTTVYKDSYKGRGIGVLTSGGDAQGMNAALRAVVRTSLYLGCKVYFIREGYQGIVEGGSLLEPAAWHSVSSIIHLAGTVIGTARCMKFHTWEGKKKAALNLITREITSLVVIGGDGSLTGAHLFRQAWPQLLDELLAENAISELQKEKCSALHVVGLVGSIDNDFSGTDMTIGVNSALHRIVEAIDAITATASSHKRAFILEVMGRRCGYLALAATLCCEADYVFLPEYPAPLNWREEMCQKLMQSRGQGRRLNIIILSEGARDLNGSSITADMIQKEIVDVLKQDTKITVLGHVQRGGNPSAFDRILACRMGIEAVLAVMASKDTDEPIVVTLNGTQIGRKPLMECVTKTQACAEALEQRQFELAAELRGKIFIRNLDAYKLMSRQSPKGESANCGNGNNRPYNFAAVCIGAPACGMNSCLYSFVRNAIYNGVVPYGVLDSVDGLVSGKFKRLEWADVDGWVSHGGTNLGTIRKTCIDCIPEISQNLEEHNIDGLLIIGGFEAFLSAIELYDARDKFPVLNLPICVVPSTISNNVPGSDFSLGCDTALNEITEICDRIRQSAQGTKRRVFIIETMGGYCGYLATLAGLAGGADAAYIWEEAFSIKDLQEDVYHLATKMGQGVQRGLVLRNENANANYNTEFIYRLYSEEGKGIFTCRRNILGHMQQGGRPSPFDRNLGIKIAAKALMWLRASADKRRDSSNSSSHDNCALIGMSKRQYKLTPISELREVSDLKHRLAKEQWWIKLRPLLKILGRHESVYDEKGKNVVILRHRIYFNVKYSYNESMTSE